MFNIQSNELKFFCWNKYLFNTEPLIDDWLEGLKSYVKQQENLIKAKDEFYMPFIGNCYIQNCISLLILGLFLFTTLFLNMFLKKHTYTYISWKNSIH